MGVAERCQGNRQLEGTENTDSVRAFVTNTSVQKEKAAQHKIEQTPAKKHNPGQ